MGKLGLLEPIGWGLERPVTCKFLALGGSGEVDDRGVCAWIVDALFLFCLPGLGCQFRRMRGYNVALQ